MGVQWGYISTGKWSKTQNGDQNLIYPLFLTATFQGFLKMGIIKPKFSYIIN